MTKLRMKAGVLLMLALAGGGLAQAQQTALVNTSRSSHAKLQSLNMGDVQWTKGFWAERFEVCKDSMLPHLTPWIAWGQNKTPIFTPFWFPY